MSLGLSLPLNESARVILKPKIALPEWIIVTLFFLVSGLFGFILLGNSFEIWCQDSGWVDAAGYHGCLSLDAFGGILLLTWVTPIGFLCLGGLLARVTGFARSVRAFLFACGAILFISAVLIVFALVIKPQVIFGAGMGPKGTGNELNGVFGGMIVVVCLFLSIVCAGLAWKYLIPPKSIAVAKSQKIPNVLDSLGAISALAIILLLSFVSSMSFSSHWNVTSTFYFPITNISPKYIFTLIMDSNFMFRLYTDVAVYYLTLACVAFFAIASHFIPLFRKILRTRLKISAILNYIVPRNSFINKMRDTVCLFEDGFASVGELVLLLVVLFLFVFWACYWPTFLFWRAAQDGQDTEVYLNATIAARTVGHCAVMSMSLMMFPVTRNSMWEAATGVSFERSIKFHRFLGTLTYLLTTTHMLIWWIKWAVEGIFWQNLFAIVGTQTGISDSDSLGNYIHWDNFTIVMAEFSWFLMTGMIVLALFFRRKDYELFYYVHHLAIGVFITTLVHAWSSWFFLLPPLIFWILDKHLRLYRTRSVPVISVDSGCGGITRLTLVCPDDFEFYSGQYVWINVPSISSLQWHPFSISSPPGAPNLTFHIKDMGPDSFTHKLSEISFHQSASLDVLMDGPYGTPLFNLDNCSTLILIGGGVGITPLISIFMDMYNRSRIITTAKTSGSMEQHAEPAIYRENSPLVGTKNLKRVVLLWTVKDEVQLAPFAEQLWGVRQNNLFDAFDIFIHVSNNSKGSYPSTATALYPDLKPAIVNFISSTAHPGRPNLPVFFQSLNCARDRSTSVFACGPEALVQDASDTAYDFNFDFHAEAFTF